jgi:hypothetical protein
MRIPPSADATTANIEQVRQMTKMLPTDGAVPMFVFDAGYDPAGLTNGLADVRAQALVRVRGDRVFFTDPPGRPGHPSVGGLWSGRELYFAPPGRLGHRSARRPVVGRARRIG